jgi:hypothetical protein
MSYTSDRFSVNSNMCQTLLSEARNGTGLTVQISFNSNSLRVPSHCRFLMDPT